VKTYIQSISLQGFRAYLAEQTFELPDGKSLAIYAPNAKGKSSLVDAIEFFFSAQGTLKRLGERKSGTQAGPEALEHVLADQKKVKEHLPQAQWLYRQITHIDDDFGPRYTHHRITDEQIEDKLKKGEKAANEIRAAEEEWLLAKAREFGVDVRIRDVDKPYSYDRGELAASLAGFLRAKKIAMPDIAGFKNPFWESLQKGTVENFGSHFQDSPSASWSSGDEKKRWEEFKAFRDLFRCPKCSKTKFKRPKVGVQRPLCAGCETPFSFKTDPS